MSQGGVENSLSRLDAHSSWQRHFLALFEKFLGFLVCAKVPCQVGEFSDGKEPGLGWPTSLLSTGVVLSGLSSF